jgi:ADP-ribose pyrophosphatase
MTRETRIHTLGVLHASSLSVELDEVRLNNHHKRRLVVRHPSAVVIVPFLSDGRVVVVGQHRYAIDRNTIEFPAGKIEPGETPDETARRELIEETGYLAGRMSPYMPFAPSPGYSDEIIHIYIAEDLERATDRHIDEEIEWVEAVSIVDLKKRMLAGDVIDATTMLALALWEWKTKAGS